MTHILTLTPTLDSSDPPQPRNSLKNPQKEDVFVTRNGKVTARIQGMTQEDYEDYLLEHDPRFIAEMKRRMADPTPGIPIDEVRRILGLPQTKPRRVASKRKQKRSTARTRK